MLKTGYHLTKEEIKEKYSKLEYRRGLDQEFNASILKLVDDLKGKRILDVGCGYGELLEEVTRHYDCEAYGVDFIDNRLRGAQEKLKAKVAIENADIEESLPYLDNYFDVVFCIEALEHLKRPDKCIKEIIRILKNNGRIIIGIPNGTGYFPFHYFGRIIPTSWLREKLLPYEHPLNTDQPVDTCYYYGEIINLLKSNGLKIIKIKGLRHFRYLQTLPLIRYIYKFVYPCVDWCMSKMRMYRFAYNLLFVCIPNSWK